MAVVIVPSRDIMMRDPRKGPHGKTPRAVQAVKTVLDGNAMVGMRIGTGSANRDSSGFLRSPLREYPTELMGFDMIPDKPPQFLCNPILILWVSKAKTSLSSAASTVSRRHLGY